ncbi:MAG TPA: extensin family protein [Pseudolabrys sp.]|nr:extensin family protein [Pseudolabrys sp.]
MIMLAAVNGLAAAEDIPLPQPRPPEANAAPWPPFNPAELTSEPSDCFKRLSVVATITPLPRLLGPGACGGTDMVRIEDVIMPDKSRVALLPAPELRCPMAESIASWVRDDLRERVAALGSTLKSVENYDAYECRGRNRVATAKISEHAKGDALDVRSLKLADGRSIEPTDVHVDKAFREGMREGACGRFTTVLGPGADGNHENHIHLDLIERRNGYRLCQWDVRDPVVAQNGPESGEIPLPRPRPPIGP